MINIFKTERLSMENYLAFIKYFSQDKIIGVQFWELLNFPISILSLNFSIIHISISYLIFTILLTPKLFRIVCCFYWYKTLSRVESDCPEINHHNLNTILHKISLHFYLSSCHTDIIKHCTSRFKPFQEIHPLSYIDLTAMSSSNPLLYTAYIISYRNIKVPKLII